MRSRVFTLGWLGLVSLGLVHACSANDDQAPSGALGGQGGPGGGRGGRDSSTAGANDESGGGGVPNGTPESAGAAERGGTRAGGGRAGQATTSNAGTHSALGGNAGRSAGGKGGSTALGEGGATAGASPSDGGAAGAPESAGAGGEATNTPCVDDLKLPLLDAPPSTLAGTGLYTSDSSAPDDVAPYVYTFTPRYPLWSDGAQKKRFVYLPKCTRIDTSDMNHWKFPVGTRFWKEFTFTVDSTPVRVETRFIHHYGPGDNDWLFIAYQWDPDVAAPTAGNTAPVPNGVVNANGTEHDIPSKYLCTMCHANLPERILGFGAFELTHNPGPITMASLGHEHLLTVAAPAGFSPPGTSVQQDGLGYLHANCGGCHNAFNGVTPTSPSPQMRLLVEQTTVQTTDTYTTLVNVPTYNPAFTGVNRIEPGDHAHSEIIARMSVRDPLQMPPIATELVDSDGVAKVSAFIDSLAP